MKKTKNEAVNSNSRTQNKNESINGNNIPSEKTVVNSKDEKKLPFKKVLYGFNPDEVQSFIDELTKSYEASLKLHESKLSAMKEELAFSNRERDKYIKKCKDYQSEIAEKTQPIEDKTDEYKATISNLTETIKRLEAENDNLRNVQIISPAVSDKQYSEKILLLENKNKELETALITAKNENTEFSKKIEECASISDEYKSALQEIEEIKSHLTLCEKELKIKCNEVEKNKTKINTLITEKNNVEKRITELEVQNNVLSQRNSECEEEISNLRETNKTIIFENAEKINALESEHAKAKLTVQKELKLYSYYIDRAELTVAELTKQIEQIKQSVNNSEI